MRALWVGELGRGAGRSLRVVARAVAIGAAAGMGSLVLDASLGEPAAWRMLVHALLVASVAGALALRDRERMRLAWDASHDALTGLFNRRGLWDRGETLRRELEAARATLAVCYVDLDDFKRHNDVHGHAVGDQLLVAIAGALKATRPTDLAARLGGDEFVLLMPRVTEAEADAAIARVREQFTREALELGVVAAFSAGIRIVDASISLDEILARGDGAMYAEKRRQKGGVGPVERSHPRLRRWVSFGVLLAVSSLGAVAPAAAQDVMTDRAAMIVDKPLPPPPPPPSPVRVELIGGTLAPIDFELAARIVFVDHILLGVAAGLTTYGGVAGQLVDENGGNGAGTTVATLAMGAFTFRAYAGIRPFDGLGLEVVGGYAMITQSARADVGGIARALGAQTTATEGHAAFTLHAATVELAWSFYLLDAFVFRPALGYMQILSADVGLSSTATTGGLDAASSALESALLQYGMTPTVSLSMGYRF